MASQYWGRNQGQQQTDVVTQSSDPTKAVEVVVDLSKSMSREEVLQALQDIRNFILAGNWPPA